MILSVLGARTVLLVPALLSLNISPATDCSVSASRTNDCCVTNPVNRYVGLMLDVLKRVSFADTAPAAALAPV
jgi:hypothetical protein